MSCRMLGCRSGTMGVDRCITMAHWADPQARATDLKLMTVASKATALDQETNNQITRGAGRVPIYS